MLYDMLLLLAIYFAATWIAFFLNGNQPLVSGTLAANLLFAGMLAISFLYFIWFWLHGGQTPGMKTWRIRLVSNNRLDLAHAALYFVGALLSWGLFGFGYWLALFHPQNRTLHDLIAGTAMLDIR